MTDFLREWHSTDEYVCAHTSGSTGTPKAIRLLKSDMIVSAQATNSFFGITADSVLAIPLSADYIAGKMMAVRADVASCRLLELPVSNTVNLSSSVDLLAIVPSQIESVLHNADIAGKVKNILVGGGPLSSELAEKLVLSGIPSYLGYGMTETCSHVALKRIGFDDYFTAMQGVSFETDGRDCLVIVSEKYSWRRLVTNDVVHLASQDRFEWLGRYDNAVISGGLKLHPEIIEEKIRTALPYMSPFYLVGEPDGKWGQRLVMVVENAPTDLRQMLDSIDIDKRMLPKRIISVRELPCTSNGKLKRVLPESGI